MLYLSLSLYIYIYTLRYYSRLGRPREPELLHDERLPIIIIITIIIVGSLLLLILTTHCYYCGFIVIVNS